MKKLCGAVFAGCLVCLCVFLFPLSVGAAQEIAYGTEQEAVLEKVEELARLRGLLVLGQAQEEQIQQAREELSVMGAVPDDSLLASMTLDKSIRKDGKSIENMADFRTAYEDLFDLYAVRQTMAVSGGVYEVCEIMVMDRDPENKRLSALTFDSVYGHLAARSEWRRQFPFFYFVKETNTTPGTYEITEYTFPVVHMIFIRLNGPNEWNHVLTTHSTVLAEQHYWLYFNLSADHIHGSEYFCNTFEPRGFDTRLSDALIAYRREDKKPMLHKLENVDLTVDVTAVSGMKNKGENIFYSYRIDIPCPTTPAEIAKHVKCVEQNEQGAAFYKEYRVVLWIVASAVAIPIFWGIFTVLERRVRRWFDRRWKKKQEQ